MQCELNPEARLELAAMAYDRWLKVYELLKFAKNMTWESAEKFCPKADWPQFHARMVADAEEALATAVRIKEQICKYSPLVLGE